MALNRLFGGVASVALLMGCSESVAPGPEAPRFAYDVSGYGKATAYSGATAGFTVVADPCKPGASMLRIDLTSPEKIRTTFAVRLGADEGPASGVYPFSIARVPGVAGVTYSDVPEILAWRGQLAFLRLTGELRLVEVADSRIAGSFDFEAVSSHFGPQRVGVKGTFEAEVDPDPVPTPLECESSAAPSWSHRIEPAMIADVVRLETPRIEVDFLRGSAVVGILTAGVFNCHASAETEIVVEGRTATITPRNYVVLPGTVCARAVSTRVATAVVPFGSGAAVIRVVGLTGSHPAGTILVERSVTIP